ncbi:MAG: helix-turn-helix transcriptional regulator [Acidobacteria bacterium]|nr:helix-turn-helix transcriptional regulator [Acidobacteriota bacterium]
MAKKFRTLLEKMPTDARARAEAKAKKVIEEMPLDELRLARDLTQEHLAKILGVKQSAISKLERRTDMYVSTLQDMIKAMGGTLEIRAVFPEGTVQINQFGRLRQRRTV